MFRTMTRCAIYTACVAASLAAVPYDASAAIFSSTSGSQCQSTAGGIAYSLTYARNDTTSNRSVYCPLQNTNTNSASYEFIYVYLKNTTGAAVDITCTAKSGHGPFIFVPAEYATASTTTNVAAGGTSIAVFDGATGLEKVSTASHLAMNCVLPPGTAVDMTWWSESDPVI
jgi:hypothetical protein